jgi:hypothetical protein
MEQNEEFEELERKYRASLQQMVEDSIEEVAGTMGLDIEQVRTSMSELMEPLEHADATDISILLDETMEALSEIVDDDPSLDLENDKSELKGIRLEQDRMRDHYRTMRGYLSQVRTTLRKVDYSIKRGVLNSRVGDLTFDPIERIVEQGARVDLTPPETETPARSDRADESILDKAQRSYF